MLPHRGIDACISSRIERYGLYWAGSLPTTPISQQMVLLEWLRRERQSVFQNSMPLHYKSATTTSGFFWSPQFNIPEMLNCHAPDVSYLSMYIPATWSLSSYTHSFGVARTYHTVEQYLHTYTYIVPLLQSLFLCFWFILPVTFHICWVKEWSIYHVPK